MLSSNYIDISNLFQCFSTFFEQRPTPSAPLIPENNFRLGGGLHYSKSNATNLYVEDVVGFGDKAPIASSFLKIWPIVSKGKS